MAITVFIACVISQFFCESFARNLSVVSRQNYYPVNTVKHASLAELERFRDAILVDARSEQQYAVSRVPGSVSLPLGSGLLRMKQFVSRIQDQRPIVVYCESEECSWAELVAKELVSLGQSNVYVLEEGFRGWKHETINE